MMHATSFDRPVIALPHGQKFHHKSFDKFRSFGFARFMNWRMNHHHHHTLSDEGRTMV